MSPAHVGVEVGYSCSVARDQDEVTQAQKLRHQAFEEEFGRHAVHTTPGLDIDHFDEFAAHLVVREKRSGLVVGTYRMISPDAARRAGGLYSESCFDLSGLDPIRAQVLELGRACVQRDHRDGAVVNLLWRGIAEYASQTGCTYVAGSPSIPLTDGGAAAAGLWDEISRSHLAPTEFRVAPRTPWSSDGIPRPARLAVPPLVRAYLRAGGMVCGPPALDTVLSSADFFMLLDMSALPPRYTRRYLESR
jgi:putative hemolysin